MSCTRTACRIFDTTLRDGEQSPGATLTSKEKLDIAKQLAKLGVDIIEAGFPVASPDDFEAVRRIAMEVGNDVQADGYVPVICGLSRTKLADLDRAWDAVRHAKRPRVHTFIATSEIHMQYKLRMTPDQVVENAVAAVKHLRSLGCNDIEFSPEDAGRSDPVFLYRCGACIQLLSMRACMHDAALSSPVPVALQAVLHATRMCCRECKRALACIWLAACKAHSCTDQEHTRQCLTAGIKHQMRDIAAGQ